MGNVVIKKLGNRAIDLLDKHPEIGCVAKALDSADVFKIAVILEWKPLLGKRGVLFKRFIAQGKDKEVGGMMKSHMLGVARELGFSQAVLRKICRSARFGKSADRALHTHLLIDMLIEKALPIVNNMNSPAFSGSLMEEAAII